MRSVIKKVENFFSQVLALFSQVEVYGQVVRKPWMAIWAFLLSYCFLATFGIIVYVYGFSLPVWKKSGQTIIQELHEKFPESLVVTWKPTMGLSWEPNQLLLVEFPEVTKSMQQILALPKYVAVFDSSVSEPSKFGEYQTATLAVVTAKTVYVSDGLGNWSITPLHWWESVPEQTITKNNITEVSQSLLEAFFEFVTFLLLMGSILGPFVLLLYLAWISLLNSILVYFMLHFQGTRLNVGQVIKVSLHLSAVAQTISILATWLAAPNPVPTFSLVFWFGWFFIYWHHRHHWSQRVS